ncbi:MAG: hypothetical protein HYZ28_03455 [Myxococcales bacterium]|nr:hypothetical protein [Myxococcales bacterium]
MSKHARGIAVVAALAVASAAKGAAWTAPPDELIFSQTSLLDLYSFYARNSARALQPLELAGGNVVQAGSVSRAGFLLTAEYGLGERVAADLSVAYFRTEHHLVGDNVRLFTDSQPNVATGFQDFTGHVKYLAYRLDGPVVVGVSPAVGWMVPMSRYDTSLNNPLGDGIFGLDLGLNSSALIPSAKMFINLDLLYRARENKTVRVNDNWNAKVHDQVQVIGEVGYFIFDWLSVRGVVKYLDSLGGDDLSFDGMPQMILMTGRKWPMFDNSLSYDQDALFVGGGPYWQINDSFGVGATYVHAMWFRNFPNMKTLVLSLSYNPQLARRKAEAEQRAYEAALAAEAAAAEAGAPEAGAPEAGAPEAGAPEGKPGETDAKPAEPAPAKAP